jgi:hypothetical protein
MEDHRDHSRERGLDDACHAGNAPKIKSIHLPYPGSEILVVSADAVTAHLIAAAKSQAVPKIRAETKAAAESSIAATGAS